MRIQHNKKEAAILKSGLLKEINDKYSLTKDDPIAMMGDDVIKQVETFSTGLPSLDYALGKGWPKGRIAEIFGPPASGKTSLALQLCKAMQATGEDIVYVDAEHAINATWLSSFLDPSRLMLVQPHFGEAALDIVIDAAAGGAGMIVVDSVAVLTPKAEYENSMEAFTRGALARMMGQFMRKVAPLVFHSETCLIMINQTRSNMSPYGNPEVTPGGSALKFSASLRLRIKKDEDIKQGIEFIGQRSSITTVKNKIAPPNRVSTFEIYFNEGIDTLSSLLDAAETLGITTKSGAWIKFGDIQWQGKEKAKAALIQDNTLQSSLRIAVLEKMEKS